MHLLKNNILINVLCKLQFVPLSAVQQYSVGQDGFTKTVAASFFDMYGTPATMLFSQAEEKTPSGSRYQQQITLSYPGMLKEWPIDIASFISIGKEVLGLHELL